MIVTKTPLRISFFGGGSDIPEFYRKHRGMVISTAINSYIYLAVNKCVAKHLKVVYSEMEYEQDIDNIKHDRVRECFKYFGYTTNMELCSFSDVPTKGTGLGSSSTFTVGLLNALHFMKHHEKMSAHDLAELAAYIEIKKCEERIGVQDQFAAAYGGFNAIQFYENKTEVIPIEIDSMTLEELNDNLLCFNTGQTRRASDLLSKQIDNLNKDLNLGFTKLLADMAMEGFRLLNQKKIDDFGALLHEGWEIKKQLSNEITNPLIDSMYESARGAGALGGKILGAGGGGYLLVYVQPKNKRAVLEALDDYQVLKFKFSKKGSSIEMYNL